MKRTNLKIFTTISFFIALTTIIVLPISIYTSTRPSGENLTSIIKMLIILTFFSSIFSIPLSIISMFSTEHLAKRIFALAVNITPVSLFAYALIVEFADEFLRTAP